MPTLVNDPGHGGRDPGAIGKTTQEKHNNLALALKVGKIVQRHNVTTSYTRTEDKDFCTRSYSIDTDLQNRIAEANKFSPNVFVSYHNDAFNKSVKGISTHCFKLGGTDEELARCIQDELAFNPKIGMLNRGVKVSNFYVLRKFDNTNTSACLVEYGFIDSEEDVILAKMDIAAEAIAKGILKFLGITYVPIVAPVIAPPTASTGDKDGYVLVRILDSLADEFVKETMKKYACKRIQLP